MNDDHISDRLRWCGSRQQLINSVEPIQGGSRESAGEVEQDVLLDEKENVLKLLQQIVS
ncbi:hypothetical protein SH668x_001616 [Planctomicrobium sp. SH668]|uniref:hypothetical protein n=1 Tax=Planctomicrobium sp. SH668 TaxID=3448126 RepID=UPI003F5B561E